MRTLAINSKDYQVSNSPLVLFTDPVANLCFVLALIQILDGLLTASGLATLGLGSYGEGNPIIRSLMESIGIIPALLAIKSISILTIAFVYQCYLEYKIAWIQHALYALISIYSIAAIVPCSRIILQF